MDGLSSKLEGVLSSDGLGTFLDNANGLLNFFVKLMSAIG